MIDWKKVQEVLDRTIEVYEVRDPKVTAERYETKRKSIEWIMSELKKGPITGGTLADTSQVIWGFGGTEWDAVREAVRVIYDDKCAICGRTNETNPELEFRFCSKCNGNYEYCNDHLFTHKHVE